ncbi:MAG TPA: insulinase family protein [Gemmatimonadaceae bacterium]|nr:insulinase family protein [Gemmatimonadaceae bacterium]
MQIARSVRMAGLAAALVLAPSVQAQFPTTAPPPAPIKPAVFPPFQEATLPNRMRLLVVQNRKQPVVAISLSFAAGSAAEPAGKSGLASMVASLLTKGAGKRSADEISAAIEGVGGSIAADAGEDFLRLGADVLDHDAKLAFELVADAAIRPTFPEKEVELLRTQFLSALQLELAQPASLASRALAKGLYGDHPYGRKADPTSVKAITRADIIDFHKARLRPSGALLVVAGSLSLAEAQRLATAAFGGWTGAPVAVRAPKAPPVRTATEIVLVHKPGAVQSNILVGNLTWKPTDPRSYAAAVVSKVLGGGAGARLFLILREQKSWTYGAYSTLERHKDGGSFEANTEVRTEVTDSALVELLAQLRRIGDEPIPAKEFADAKNSLTGAFPLTIESASQVAAQVSSASLLGLPSDYVATYRQKLAAVTVPAAQAAARAAVRPNQALIVVVGDGAKFYEKIKGIAPVKIIAADGSPLTAADLTVKAAALDLAMDRLIAHTDSFAIMVQGNPIGWQVAKLEKDAGGWTYSERMQIASFVQQSTDVHFTDKLEMQSVHQTGKQGGQDGKIDVTYAAGRAKGSATTPAQGGAKTIAVDAEVPAGAIDDNLVTVILPALKWASGAKFSVVVFQSGKGSALTLSIAVAGEESVKVPAGTFDAWKADVTGGPAPITVWIEKGGAHRMLKLALVGQPVEFQLAK